MIAFNWPTKFGVLHAKSVVVVINHKLSTPPTTKKKAPEDMLKSRLGNRSSMAGIGDLDPHLFLVERPRY